ncbi:site-specific integrase [Pseudomonas atacamensis]|uniref:site-specific integrase n=1 Tax=Pseudomonas atacamensis TaxID=2565368 RepID=UPI00215DF29E|nr:site-specific integrase [Pseudomonas atacamensis]UVL15909.1 site-specific integrase [Pseudomonas atacamensis]
MPDNLIQKKGESTWYVRMAVPVDVQHKLGVKVLIQSLKTGLRKEAMDARLPILAGWKARIKMARDGIPLPEGWQDEIRLLDTNLGQIFKNQKLALVGAADSALPPLNQTIEARMKSSPKFVSAFESYVREHLKEGLAGKVRLLDDMSKTFQSMIPQILGRQFNLPDAQLEEVTKLLLDPSNHKIRSPITTARMKAFREFREARSTNTKHIDQQVSRMERLSKFLNEKGLPLNFDAVDEWLKSMNRSPATLGQHLMAGTALWNWAMKYDAVWREEYKDKINPFTGHDLPQGGGSETAGQDREIYTRDDALKLRQAALANKDQPLSDLIMFGWYTGARIEELCRLSKNSVITVDGIRCFDFPKSKSKASKRVVPIHPNLLPIVDRLCKDSIDNFLIPTESSDKYDKRSHAISKAFGRLRTAAGFSKLHVFHSFRHTVITELIRGDVPEHLAKELVGHETGSVMHDVYSKGSSTAQKLAAISKLAALDK